MAVTVTATPTGGAGNLLRVLVLTGATAAGGASVGPAGSTGGSTSLTPNGSNSYVVWSGDNEGSNGAYSAISNNAILDNVATTGGTRMGTGNYTGTVTAGTPITVGATAASSPATESVYEILASGGVTPTLDASSPAVVSHTSGTTACTTASFSPPAGAVIVAICTGGGFVTSWAVTDTGGGYTWTKRIDNGNGQVIYTATVPASGANVNLTTPNLALAAPLLTPGASANVNLTTPNLALAAPLVTPAGGSAGVNVNLTTPNLALAAPVLAPTAGASIALTTPNLSLNAPVLTLPGGFPTKALGVGVELNLSGNAWTDISSFVKLDSAAGVTITRGRADGSQTVNPSSAGMTWSNLDGRFSPRNPLGPYYGQLGRNTPVRVSIPAQTNYLRIAADATSYISAPDSVGLSPTGSVEFQLDLKLTSYVPCVLASKDDALTQRSWSIRLNGDGTIGFYAFNSGSASSLVTSTAPLPLGRIALKVTLNTSTGTVTFFTAPTIGGAWTQLGKAVTGSATSLFDSTTAVILGYNAAITALGSGFGGPTGSIFAFKFLNGIGGTVVASPDFTLSTPGASSLTDAQGNVWTLNGTAEFSARNYRFHGECAALPQTWDRDDIWTPVSTAGVLRRINQNNDNLQSPIYRGLTQITGATAPVAYWPAEDASGSTQIAAAIGGQPMNVNGPIQFAANSDFICSQPLPVVNNSSWSASVPPYPSGGNAVIFRFLMEVPAAGETDGVRIARIHCSGTVRTFTLFYHTGGKLEVIGYDQNGNQLFDSGSVSFNVNGTQLRVSMELLNSGGNVAWSLRTLAPAAGSTTATSGLVSGSVGNAKKVMISPDYALTGTVIGQVSVQSTWDDLTLLSAQLNAFQGETAATRFARLCGEEGINCRIYGNPVNSVMMGAQSVDNLANLLQECESTDNGMTFEPLDTLGLGYRTSGALCAQSAAVALDYSLDQLSPPLSPTDDDQYTQNDITVTEPDGTSARAVLNDGSAMSISDPPVGVGSYISTASINSYLPAALNNVANWLLHLGTVNEERYPEVMVDLAATSMQSLFWPVMGVGVGDMLTVGNVPYFLPPDGIKAIVWGDTEVLGDYVCNVTWQTQPESPYEVLVAGSGSTSDCRADTSGSTLHASLTSGATSFQVDTANGNMIWTTTAGDFPFDIIVGGERMTVTNITGTSSPQTFTVTRAVNGVAKSHNAGESVSIFQPCYAALA